MDNNNNNNNNNEDNVYLFGYGSLINNDSRKSSLSEFKDSKFINDAALVSLSFSFGYIRAFCMRSDTGFTCLGLMKNSNNNKNKDICGIIFPVDNNMMKVFDQREKGYTKKLIPIELLKIIKTSEGFLPNSSLPSNSIVYVYIPNTELLIEADESFPIIQTYIDVCLSGCNYWGGKSLMKEFCESTYLWNNHYLNDPPMSRRPWLYRPDYQIIDEVLSSLSNHTFFEFRKHTEEYSKVKNNSLLVGIWGTPQKNNFFVGRESTLLLIQEKIVCDGYIEINGLGGVGKSSLAIEYCYRNIEVLYSLIIFLRAESKTSIAADLRRFASDMCIINESSLDGNTNEYDDEIIVEEVKRRLSQLRDKYLIVFDNFEGDISLLSSYLPRGILLNNNNIHNGLFNKGNKFESVGHVIVTRRVAIDNIDALSIPNFSKKIMLDRLDPMESLKYLSLSLQEEQEFQSALEYNDEIVQLKELAEQLGHFPLALNQAVAYMNRCDVSIIEYLKRLEKATSSDSIFSSLSMAIDRIEQESDAAMSVLRLLAWICPDNITKQLVHRLLVCCYFKMNGPQYVKKENHNANQVIKQEIAVINNKNTSSIFFMSMISSILLISASFIPKFSLKSNSNSNKLFYTGIIAFTGSLLTYIDYSNLFIFKKKEVIISNKINVKSNNNNNNNNNINQNNNQTNNNEIVNVNNITIETDRVWELLKQFSLLKVRGTRQKAKASIHRMQQTFIRSKCNGDCSNDGFISDISILCVEQCIFVLDNMCSFNTLDQRTWDYVDIYGTLLDHIEALSSYTDVIVKIRIEYIVLFTRMLTNSAIYIIRILSRFDTALLSLNKALHLQSIIELNNNIDSDILKASIYHAIGVVNRLIGNFEESKNSLIKALDIRKKINLLKRDNNNDIFVAESLHELGILSLRIDRVNEAEEYLQNSLKIKQLYNINNNNNINNNHNESTTTLSATLHQLAVVATNQKRYDDAEKLLKDALELDLNEDSNEKSSSRSINKRKIVSRAAATQQLGRVSLRRGLIEAARIYFEKSIVLYGEGYGSNMIHINVAAARHQLGLALGSLSRFDEAIDQFNIALNIKKTIYDGMDNIEIITTLQSLGQTHLELNNYDEADIIFVESQDMLERLIIGIQNEYNNNNNNNNIELTKLDYNFVFDSISSDSTKKHRLSAFIRNYLSILYSRRTVSKKLGNKEKNLYWSSEIQKFRKAFSISKSNFQIIPLHRNDDINDINEKSSSSLNRSISHNTFFNNNDNGIQKMLTKNRIDWIIKTRQNLRNYLFSLKVIIKESKENIDCIKYKLDILKTIILPEILETSKSIYENVFDCNLIISNEDNNNKDSNINCIGRKFIQNIYNLDISILNYDQSVLIMNQLLQMCDMLRNDLNNNNIKIEDSKINLYF